MQSTSLVSMSDYWEETFECASTRSDYPDYLSEVVEQCVAQANEKVEACLEWHPWIAVSYSYHYDALEDDGERRSVIFSSIIPLLVTSTGLIGNKYNQWRFLPHLDLAILRGKPWYQLVTGLVVGFYLREVESPED